MLLIFGFNRKRSKLVFFSLSVDLYPKLTVWILCSSEPLKRVSDSCLGKPEEKSDLMKSC